MPRLSLRGLRTTALRRLALAAAVAATGAVQTVDTARADSLSGLYLAALHAEALPDYKAAGRYYRRALLRAPGMRPLMAPALEYTIASGYVERAPAIARRLLKHDPTHRFALLALIADDIKNERFDSARERLANAPEGSLTEFVITLAGAWAAVGAGDQEAADAAFEAAGADSRLSVFGQYHRGLLAMMRGDPTAAVEAYEAARNHGGRLNPRLAEAYGAALEQAGRSDEAETIYRQVLADDSGDPTMLAALARMARGEPAPLPVNNAVEGAAEVLHGLGAALGQDQRAAQRNAIIYAQLARYLRPDYPAAQILVASLLDDLDQLDAAAEMFDAVDAKNPTYVVAQLGRARALSKLDRTDEALDALQALTLSGLGTANVHFTLADILSGEERFAECAQNYDAGLELLEPIAERHWVVFFSRGICRERIGAWADAEADFEQALEMRPEQPDVLNYLGYSLVEQGLRFDEARGMIEQAVAARPDSGYIVDSLGWVLYRMGDFDEAVAKLERAVELTPVEPVINDHFGDALWMVGRRMEARFQWRRALSFDPDEKDRDRIERKLDIGLDAVLIEEQSDQGGALADPNAPENADAAPVAPAQGG